jgi:AcrR family transcriptional regulator
VELAADLFAEQGYIQTSIRDIARRGALTSGAIYGHFRNKADLLVEAINMRTTEELEAQSMDLGEDIDHVESLTRLARERNRDRLSIDSSVDMETAVLLTWAIELGLGVLEGVGIEPRSKKSWADMNNRVARSLQLPPDTQVRTPPRKVARKRA